MKKIIIAALAIIVCGAAQAKDKTVKFKVNGRCERCGKRITTTAKGIDGVKTAEWDEVTKDMVVTFDRKNTTKKDIQRAIVGLGFTAGKMKPAPSKEKKHDPNCGKGDCKD